MDARILCLGVLSRGERSGYEIRKQFEDGPFAHVQDANFGSIYPALRRLTEEGLVVGEERLQEARPDKKVYRITPAGRRVLYDAVTAPPGPDKYRSDFGFVLLFAALLPPRAIDGLIADRIKEHDRVLARLEALDLASLPAADAFVVKQTMAVHRAAKGFLEAHAHELIGAMLQPESTG